MNDLTPKEAIANLNHLYGMVSPDMQRSLDVVIKAVERPSGDCISRSDLVQAFKEECCGNCHLCERFAVFENGIHHCGLIDNAQTIPLPNEQTAWEQGYEAGLAQGKQDRQQGEWCYGEDECGQDGWFCSECGFFVPWYYQYYEKDINFIRDYKACPHCLAEMVTYTGKDRDTEGGKE